MNAYIRIFQNIPYAVFAVTFVLFVLRLGCRWRGKALWTAWLAFCCTIFLAFQRLGHTILSPEFPELLVWFWNWAYCGALILAGLSVLCPFRFRRKGVILPLVAWALAAWGLWNCLKVPDVREVEFAFADLPETLDGYRIVQVSDLHVSSALRGWRTRAIVERVNALGADLVCLTGDLGDGKAELFHGELAPLAGLRAKDGVWAVSGNHEWFPAHAGWWAWYGTLGIRFLENACVFPRKGLALGGVHDNTCRRARSGAKPEQYPDVGKAFAAATNGEFRILLEHHPLRMRENLTRHGVRLQLSGHTHGGIMPGLATLVARTNGGFLRGAYRTGDSFLYVNPGCGQSAAFLMRFFDPSEITLVTLRRRARGGGRDGHPQARRRLLQEAHRARPLTAKGARRFPL